MRLFGTILAALLGLSFGSFLNVCLNRWPEEESVISPASHCPLCGHGLSWWENIPLLSWIALGGRCRSCREWISLRYPLIEATMGALWALVVWRTLTPEYMQLSASSSDAHVAWISAAGHMLFCWLLVALAALDAEHYWLPDWLTLPGAAIGFLFASSGWYFHEHLFTRPGIRDEILSSLLGITIPSLLLLLIRWLYGAVRKREGLGLGDVKLMAMLGAWLGLGEAFTALVLGAMLGALAALVLLFLPRRADQEPWALQKIPLGAFLAAGGLISCFWGPRLLHSYMDLAGLR